MATTLQFLHQNLYRLKSCKLMDNKLFKQLYDEAKNHEKNANLLNLVSRAKNQDLANETNFFLILTRMLEEVKDCDENNMNVNVNLEKIYRWYYINKKHEKNYKTNYKKLAKLESEKLNTDKISKSLDSTRKESSRMTNRINTNTQSDDFSKENKPMSSVKKSRNLSPIYFPSLSRNNPNTPATVNPANSNYGLESDKLNVELLKSKYNSSENMNKLGLINNKKNSNKLEKIKRSIPLLTKSNIIQDDNLLNQDLILDSYNKFLGNESVKLLNENKKSNNKIEKITFEDSQRQGILKALSLYADQLYSNLDQKDTKKLENNLKSLSRFYNTLNETEKVGYENKNKDKTNSITAGNKFYESSITMQTLIEMAKEVSDKMIISKAQTDIRMYENKLLFDNFNRDGLNKSNYQQFDMNDLNAMPDIDDVDFMNSKQDTDLKTYSVTIKNPNSRPKSSSYIDWRGQITKPVSVFKTSKSVLKFTNTSYPSLNKENDQSNTETNESSNNNNNTIQSETVINNTLNNDMTLGEDNENKNIQKEESNDNQLNQIFSKERTKSARSISRSRQSHRSEVSMHEPKEIKFVSFVSKVDFSDAKTSTNEEATYLSLAHSQKIKNSESSNELKCQFCTNSNSRLNTCESCKESSNTHVFHLTSANNELITDIDSSTTGTAGQAGLKEILINNFDPKFASRIGIDFVPLQVMSSQDLRFIPFEKIDGSYPKIQGAPVFDPNYNKSRPKLYRTNPSIPRPESRYGSRSTIYDKVIQLKRSRSDPSDLSIQIYQPEDVHLVRDILNLEYEPLNQVLKVESLKPDLDDKPIEKNSEENKSFVNKNLTPMGRPINTHKLIRWKPLEIKPLKNQHEDILEDDEFTKKSESALEDKSSLFRSYKTFENIETVGKFKITGNSYTNMSLFDGRPIPTELEIQNENKRDDALNKFNETKKAVNIGTLFKGTTIRNYVKEFNLEERRKKEERRIAAIKIQRNYRQHLKDKKFIENRSTVSQEALDWARNYKITMLRKKLEKEKTMLEEHLILEKENAKLKAIIKRIGIHRDLYQILHKKGPEYTNKIINRAVVCIQKWVRGHLIRNKIKNLKKIVTQSNGGSWSSFIRRYTKTIRRIQRIRGTYHGSIEFDTNEATDFFTKEKKYSSYFEKLSFAGELDQTDLEKLFNFCDHYPNPDEIKEAKYNVLKYHKTKNMSSPLPKVVTLDVIYYIYPPVATKLKSTRKSTWLGPIVGGEDALRLKGSKIVEPATFEKSWKLVRSNLATQRKFNTPNMENEEFNQK